MLNSRSLRLVSSNSAIARKCGNRRTFSVTSLSLEHHKILVVGAGAGGLAVSAQLLRAFKADGKALGKNDIAIIDPATTHHYQPGWTLVGSGVSELKDMHQPLSELLPEGATHYPLAVKSFDPKGNSVTASDSTKITYDWLVVAAGLQVNFDSIPGLVEGLAEEGGPVCSIYSYETVEKTWNNIKNLTKGTAIFTQPMGIIKCAGAPQKIMWMANSQWNRAGTRKAIEEIFATATPTMFGVAKYSQALEVLRQKRNVTGLFSHELVAIDNASRTATFKKPDGEKVQKSFDLLHVVPPQGPPAFIKSSPLADAAGWVSVNPATTQHTAFPNVFSLGDSSSMPNSKTAAAITAQAPVLVDNLRSAMKGEKLVAVYDGYASCPILTGHDELMLAEFKYGGIPKESFAWIMGSQHKPRQLFYLLNKNIFPWVYFNALVKGTWFGANGFFRPDTAAPSLEKK